MTRSTYKSPRLSALVRGFIACLLACVLAACGSADTQVQLGEPSGVTATAGPGYITVSWQDNSNGETAFEVYRNGVHSAMQPNQLSEPLATVPANTTEFVDMDVELEVDYDYSVVAVRNGVKSGAAAASSTAQVSWGVDLMVGTTSIVAAGQATGTILIPYFVFPEELLADPSVQISYEISGPPGWYSDASIKRNPEPLWNERFQGFWVHPMNYAPAVAGAYSISAMVDGVSYQATAELLDTDFRLPRSSGHDVLDVTSSSVTANWTPSPAAVREVPRIHNAGGTTHTIFSTDFVPGATVEHLDEFVDGVHVFEVMSANSDIVIYPVKVAQFGVSYAGTPFAYGSVPLGICSSLDQVIPVPDADLVDAIRSVITKPEGQLTCLDLMALQRLYWIVSDISSLEGLQYAGNLETAILYNNDITDLEPLRNLTNLSELGLNLNPLSDLSPIAHMTWLKRLEVNATNVEDISFLADFSELSTLYLGYTDVTDVSAVAGLTQLQFLSLQGLGITDIGFLEDFQDPHSLWLDGNSISSLAALVNNLNIGDGDYIGIAFNGLNLEDAGVMFDIQSLLDRGVDVGYEPQE